jgi:hypothetical protein
LIASVLEAVTSTPAIPSPACALGLFTHTAEFEMRPVIVKLCDAVVLEATAAGVSATE